MRIELPKPEHPLVTRVISKPFLPEQGTDVLVWAFKSPHPLEPKAYVVGMFIENGGVNVYAIAEDAQGEMTGSRTFVPGHSLLLVLESGMPMDVFADELARSIEGEEDEDELDFEDQAEVTQPINGQPTSS